MRAVQILIWPSSHVYLPPESTAAKPRPVSIAGTLVVYSDIPQMQDLPSQSWGFNPRLVQPHREISVPLPQFLCPWGSALVLAPPLHVGHPLATVPRPGKRE